ncbi:MAG: hypothetical protein ACFB8W_19680 [Elainellaceae cyanobacterium]
MSEVQSADIDRHNQEALAELCRLLRFSQGEFELILAVCNSSQHRQVLVEQLQQQCSIGFQTLTLDAETTTLYTTIQHQLSESPPNALMVFGLEAVEDLEHVLTATNQIREEFRQFPFPLVLRLSDNSLKQLIRTAPDFYTWANPIAFETPAEFFLTFLDELIRDVWHQVVQSRENRFLSNEELGLTPNSPRCRELQIALSRLEAQSIALTSAQAAALEFVRGRIADNNTPVAREHYEQSLAQWRPLTEQNGQADTTYRENIGHVQFYLGLWWRNHAVRHRRESESACEQARAYFEAAVSTFEQIQRPDLAAGYINFLAEALHRLERWPELEAIATKAVALHQEQEKPLRQARAAGFLAEVALAKEVLHHPVRVESEVNGRCLR